MVDRVRPLPGPGGGGSGRFLGTGARVQPPPGPGDEGTGNNPAVDAGGREEGPLSLLARPFSFSFIK